MVTSSGTVIQAVDAGFFNAPPKAHPGTVYVVSYRAGHLRSFSGIPSYGDRIGSKFCFLVNTTEQHSSSTVTVNSADDAYEFSVELSANWRVTDPEAAVRDDLTDPGSLVLGSLQDLTWQIARGFEPQRAAAAEAAVRGRLARPFPLNSGVTVLRAAARFRADAAVTGATRGLDTDAHQGALERQRMARIRELFDGTEAGALMMHMLQHPDDTGSVLNTLRDDRDKETALRLALVDGDRKHYLAMLDRALANDLISDSDAQPLRDVLFGQAPGGAISSGSVAMVPIASRPPLSLPAGIAGGAGNTAGYGTPGPAQAPPGQAQPGQAQPAAPVAHGYVVEDVVVSGPPVAGAPAAPAPDSPPPAVSEQGGVKGWKPLKNRGQGSA